MSAEIFTTNCGFPCRQTTDDTGAVAFSWEVAGLEVSAAHHGVTIKGQLLAIEDVDALVQLLRVAESVWHDLACGVGAVAVKRRLTMTGKAYDA
jgi:hypothetical protein